MAGAESSLRPSPEAAPGASRVPLGTVLAWGPPVFALSGLLFFVQFFFLKFATDVLLMAPATVGVIFALGRAWDAVSDPIAGTLSDRTRARLGRRRPWMLFALPLLAAAFVMIWTPPQALAGGALVVWVAVALFGFYSAFTAYGIPHQALGAELTDDYHDRSRVFGVRAAFFTLGIMLAFGGMQFVNNAEAPREAARMLSLGALVVILPVLLVPPLLVRERSEYQGRGAGSSFKALRDVLRNRHARRLLAVQFIDMIGMGVLGILSPFVIQYVLRRPDLIGPLPAIFVVFSIASIPLWIRASRRFGKRNVWIASLVGAALSFGAMIFVQENDVVLMGVLLVSAGAASGCGSLIGPSILADVIDYDEYESGQRKEGVYSAAWGFAIKSANALVILATGVALQLAGFEPNAEQQPSTQLALRGLFAGMPFVALLTGAALLRGFSFDQQEHARIRAALDQRG